MFLKAWNKNQKVISSPLLGMGIVRNLIIWLWFLLGVQFFNGSIKDIWKKYAILLHTDGSISKTMNNNEKIVT